MMGDINFELILEEIGQIQIAKKITDENENEKFCFFIQKSKFRVFCAKYHTFILIPSPLRIFWTSQISLNLD